jgi:hypothetical protein
MSIALYILTTAAFLGFSTWFLLDPGLVPVVGMGVAVAGIIGSWLTDENRKRRERQYWQDRRLTVGVVTDRVEKELDHLFALRGRQASGLADAKESATLPPTLDLLRRDVALLTSYRAYRSLAQSMLKQIDAVMKNPGSDVGGLLRLVEQLDKKLKADPSWIRAER